MSIWRGPCNISFFDFHTAARSGQLSPWFQEVQERKSCLNTVEDISFCLLLLLSLEVYLILPFLYGFYNGQVLCIPSRDLSHLRVTATLGVSWWSKFCSSINQSLFLFSHLLWYNKCQKILPSAILKRRKISSHWVYLCWCTFPHYIFHALQTWCCENYIVSPPTLVFVAMITRIGTKAV